MSKEHDILIKSLYAHITELEKELKIVEEELCDLCAIDSNDDVRGGYLVKGTPYYRYGNATKMIFINRLNGLLKRLTLPAEEADDDRKG